MLSSKIFLTPPLMNPVDLSNCLFSDDFCGGRWRVSLITFHHQYFILNFVVYLLTLYPGFPVSGSRSDSLSTGVSLNVKDEKLFNLLRLEDLVDESGARLLLGTLNIIDCWNKTARM